MQEPLYNTVHYRIVSDMKLFKGRPLKCGLQTKIYSLCRKKTAYVYFFIYIIDTF